VLKRGFVRWKRWALGMWPDVFIKKHNLSHFVPLRLMRDMEGPWQAQRYHNALSHDPETLES